VGFRVADKGGDVVGLEERVCEDLGGGEAGGLVCWLYDEGRVLEVGDCLGAGGDLVEVGVY
jgi:hypothetical protein